MAQRDEGLDRLEAFIGLAAETRAALQRDAEKLSDVEGVLEELGERLDGEMKDLGTTVRELDARYGPTFEVQVAIAFGVSLAPFATAAGMTVGFQLAHTQRQVLIASADGLEAAYEHFPQARREAVDVLSPPRPECRPARSFTPSSSKRWVERPTCRSRLPAGCGPSSKSGLRGFRVPLRSARRRRPGFSPRPRFPAWE
jgi:hypothetical protein